MRRTKPYLILVGCLLLAYLLPMTLSSSLRQKGVSLFKMINSCLPKKSNAKEIEIENLRSVEMALRDQMETVRELLLSDVRLEKQKELLQDELAEKKIEYIRDLLKRNAKALPAKVIFREPATWNSYAWISVGERDNRKLGEKIVVKNSPVVVGNKLVGVIEEVRENQSRVCFVTHSTLSLSVRASRGDEQNLQLLRSIEELQNGIELCRDLNDEDTNKFLTALKEKVQKKTGNRFLAKGIVKGSGHPLWRMPSNILQGSGFQYDFVDEEGKAMDLRQEDPPILKVGDLLLTTGLDGIFPKGLVVGTVIHVDPLQKEDYAYRLKARLAVENIHEIEWISVFPPLQAQ